MHNHNNDIRCEIFLAIVGFMDALIGGVLVIQGAPATLLLPAIACIFGLMIVADMKTPEVIYG